MATLVAQGAIDGVAVTFTAASAGGDLCPQGQGSGGFEIDPHLLLVQNDGLTAVDVTLGTKPVITVLPCGRGVWRVAGANPVPVTYSHVDGVKVASIKLR
jgi:hypothetical protein